MSMFPDGSRLYVTTSLFSHWDKQFYPDMCDKVNNLEPGDKVNKPGTRGQGKPVQNPGIR